MRKFCIVALILLCPAFSRAQSLATPNCGLNANSSNLPPSGAGVTTVTPPGGGTPTTYSWHDFVANVPGVGGTWIDNAYGCVHQILTNAAVSGAGQAHNYAITPALDRSDCYLLAVDANNGLSTQYVMYVGSPSATPPGRGPANCPGNPGQTVISSAQMPARTSHNEFVWDYFTGGKFWFANGNLIRNCTITGPGTLSCVTAHTFAEYAAAGCNLIDYAAMNSNGFIDVVCQATSGGTMDVFVYDTVHDVKGDGTAASIYHTGCTGALLTSNQPGCIHKMAGPTIDNGILIQFVGNSCGTENGNHLWAPPWTIPTPQIECLTDHVDVMGDLSVPSKSVALYEDFRDNSNYCTAGFRPSRTFLPLSGNPVGLLCFPVTELSMDISTRDHPLRPWGLYSAQGQTGSAFTSTAGQCNSSGSYADPTTANWAVLFSEIALVRVDANNDYTKVWRLGLTHERGQCGPTGANQFYIDPRASISIDGNYVVYDTNARFGATGTGAPIQSDIVIMGPLFSGGAQSLVGNCNETQPTSASLSASHAAKACKP